MNGGHISEVPKFLADCLSVTMHAIEMINPFDAAHPLIILLLLSSVISNFDVYSPSVEDYEN